MRPIVQFVLYFIAGFLQLLVLLFVWGFSAGAANAWPYVLLVAFLEIGSIASGLSLFFEKPGALAAVLGGMVGLCWPLIVVFSEDQPLNALAMIGALPLFVTLDGLWRLFKGRASPWFTLAEGPNLVLRAALGSLPFVVAGVMAFPLITATKVTFIIPDGYMGEITIVFKSTQTAQKTENDGGARTYELPKSGIALATDYPVRSWTRRKYFYRKSDGSLREIDTIWSSTIHNADENRADPTVGIFFHHSGSVTTANKCRFEHESFTVGTKSFILHRSAPQVNVQRMEKLACGSSTVN